uniref:Uncharacterized protein n=1 Tax=Oryza sativa subsp. japonica TaxID=39947 RepID=Q69SV9_ORYSJ|nr:hypothetical protein [Oryza sativa Japonica Group]
MWRLTGEELAGRSTIRKWISPGGQNAFSQAAQLSATLPRICHLSPRSTREPPPGSAHHRPCVIARICRSAIAGSTTRVILFPHHITTPRAASEPHLPPRRYGRVPPPRTAAEPPPFPPPRGDDGGEAMDS